MSYADINRLIRHFLGSNLIRMDMQRTRGKYSSNIRKIISLLTQITVNGVIRDPYTLDTLVYEVC